ncbi:hypothetical protein H9P43_009598 [Blastocladiella emersonii ATCC 22665]|nr:hypothetical protein H9P43_009598 [Blastocladiella emersonii ATCC 22665]
MAAPAAPAARETTVLLGWEHHLVYTPVDVYGPAAASSSAAAAAEPAPPLPADWRGVPAGVFFLRDHPVHWYLEQWGEAALPWSARTASVPGARLHLVVAAARPSATRRIAVHLHGLQGVHLVRATPAADNKGDVLDVLLLTWDARLLSVRIRIPPVEVLGDAAAHPYRRRVAKALPAPHAKVAGTSVGYIKTRRPRLVVAHGDAVFTMASETNEIAVMRIDEKWTPRKESDSWSGSVSFVVRSLDPDFFLSAAGAAHLVKSLFSRAAPVDMAIVPVDDQAYLGVLMSNSSLRLYHLVEHTLVVERALAATNLASMHVGPGRILFRSTAGAFSVASVFLLNDTAHVSDLQVVPSSGLPDDKHAGDGLLAFADAGWISPTTVAALFTGPRTASVTVAWTSGETVWSPVAADLDRAVDRDLAAANAPAADLHQLALRALCAEFNVPVYHLGVAGASPLTVEGVAEDYARQLALGNAGPEVSAIDASRSTTNASSSSAGSVVTSTAVAHTHVTMFVHKFVSAYLRGVRFVRVEQKRGGSPVASADRDGDVDMDDDDETEVPGITTGYEPAPAHSMLWIIKRGGFGLLRASTPLEDTVAELEVAYNAEFRDLAAHAAYLPHLDPDFIQLFWFAERIGETVAPAAQINAVMRGDAPALAALREGAQARIALLQADEAEAFNALCAKFAALKNDRVNAVTRNFREIVNHLNFIVETSAVAAAASGSAADGVPVPHLLCPLLNDLLGAAQTLARAVVHVMAAIPAFSRVVPCDPAELVARLRPLFTLPDLVVPEVLPLLNLDPVLTPAAEVTGWAADQLAAAARAATHWTYAQQAEFVAAAPASATAALLAAARQGTPQHAFLHGLSAVLAAKSPAESDHGLDLLQRAAELERELHGDAEPVASAPWYVLHDTAALALERSPAHAAAAAAHLSRQLAHAAGDVGESARVLSRLLAAQLAAHQVPAAAATVAQLKSLPGVSPAAVRAAAAHLAPHLTNAHFSTLEFGPAIADIEAALLAKAAEPASHADHARWLERLGSMYHQCGPDFRTAARCYYMAADAAAAAGAEVADVQVLVRQAANALRLIANPAAQFVMLRGPANPEADPEFADLPAPRIVPLADLDRVYDELTLAVVAAGVDADVHVDVRAVLAGGDPYILPSLIAGVVRCGDRSQRDMARAMLEKYRDAIRALTGMDMEWIAAAMAASV